MSSVDPGSCLIGETCYTHGDVNPGNDCEECDAGSPSSWTAAPPLEVLGLLLSQAGPTTLTWTGQGAAAIYDVAGGDLSVLHSSAGTDDALCLVDDVATVTWDDLRANPALADAYYYLVRSQKSCGVGTYGTASDTTERLPLVDCP